MNWRKVAEQPTAGSTISPVLKFWITIHSWIRRYAVEPYLRSSATSSD